MENLLGSFPSGWDDGFAAQPSGEHVLQRSRARAIASVDRLVESTVRRVLSALAIRTLSKVADIDGTSDHSYLQSPMRPTETSRLPTL